MIAAARRRALVARVRAEALTRRADRELDRLLRALWPCLVRAAALAAAAWRRAAATARWLGRRLRPVAVLALRVLGGLERRLRRATRRAIAAATRASAVLTPERAVGAAIVASAGCLAASQFVTFHSVEIGSPGYAGLPAAAPPSVGAEPAGAAHAYVLLPVAALVAALAILAVARRRRGLAKPLLALGAGSIAIALAIDLPAGLDAGNHAARFSGATAVLETGFFAELASAAGIVIGALVLIGAPAAASRYHARRCRTRTSSFARAASALARRPRRRASSRGRAARSGSRRRSVAASAPGSRP